MKFTKKIIGLTNILFSIGLFWYDNPIKYILILCILTNGVILIKVTDNLLGRDYGFSNHLITYVKDRAGHDKRYAIDSSKIKNELGWEPSLHFEEGIEKTVSWYLNNKNWLDNVNSGKYRNYYKEMYE